MSIWGSSLWLLLLAPAHGGDPLQLLSVGAAANGGVSAGVEQVRCVFNRMDEPVVIRNERWATARRLLQDGDADGLFPAPLTSHWVADMVTSSPLMLERWVWWSRAGEADSGGRTGALPGGAVSDYLQSQRVSVDVQAESLGQLLRLLAAGRIDRFLADRHEVERQARLLQMDLTRFSHDFSRYVPLGVVLRPDVVKRSPGFLPRMEATLSNCGDNSLMLDASEMVVMRDAARLLLEPWSRDAALRAALRSVQQPSRAQAVIDHLDAQWLAEEALTVQPQHAALLKSAVSRRLLELAMTADPPVAELFVTDRDGITVGALKPTSDLWQGDEPKFSTTITQNGPFIEDLRYDVSSHAFVVPASIAIRDRGQLLGVVTLGIDIARVMKKHPLP